jgi:hypothetical protein
MVSINPPSGRFVGRARSADRICANFGSCDRFLLFLNVAVDDIHSADAVETQDGRRIEWRREAVNFKTPTMLGRRFLEMFGDYPIARIRMKPGDAYISPTEDIVHEY